MAKSIVMYFPITGPSHIPGSPMANSIIHSSTIIGPSAFIGENTLTTDAYLTDMPSINSTYNRAPAQEQVTWATENLIDAFWTLHVTIEDTESDYESFCPSFTANSKTSKKKCGTDIASDSFITSTGSQES